MSVRIIGPRPGTVTYRPRHDTDSDDLPLQFRRTRYRATGRIRIASVPSHQDLARVAASHHRTTFLNQRLTLKLAVSRESARRFLKAVIAQNSSENTTKTAPQTQGRTWQSAERSNSTDSGVEGALGTMRSSLRNSIGGPVSGMVQRPRLNSDVRNASNQSGWNSSNPSLAAPSPKVKPAVSIASDGVSNFSLDDEKPIASGNGVSIGVRLAEPVLFLQGFDNNETAPGNTAMLRGSLHVRVQKSAKIKTISLRFKGSATTKWPEGIPPRKVDFEEVNTIMNHTWPFFNAQFESAENGTGADHVQLFKGGDPAGALNKLDPLGRSSPSASAVNLSTKDARKLSLQVNQSRSFGKGDTPSNGPSVAAKGYRTFLPGDYVYNFELPIDSRLPETIDVELGNVKYGLEAIIERAGAFRSNLLGTKEVTLIRAPGEGSLEQVEPIAISRNWEDQLHYDIVISGKSFPLGSQIPIAFKLTPLAKVQCHRIKVLVTENIEYFCSNKHVHRMEPTRKVQLFEKRSDSEPTSTFPGSTMRITAGGGVPYDARARAARGEHVTPSDATNLLGNLEGDTNIGPTEMEFNVQLPSCHSMRDRDRTQRLHFDTTHQNIQVHHWIKIVMRLSKPDQNDPTKRRHFEISIDSPFHILSCQATQANTSLPAYSSPTAGLGNSTSLYECGCPGAARRRNSPASFNALLNPPNNREDLDRPTTPTLLSPGLARPPTAHVHDIRGQRPSERGPMQPRPMHIIRQPSFNPPAFEDEEPPPALITPPPQYDSIASPTNGLADYFARLSDAYDEDEDGDEVHRGGRVNVPLTPGARINRSMDLRRDGRSWVQPGSYMNAHD